MIASKKSQKRETNIIPYHDQFNQCSFNNSQKQNVIVWTIQIPISYSVHVVYIFHLKERHEVLKSFKVVSFLKAPDCIFSFHPAVAHNFPAFCFQL